MWAAADSPSRWQPWAQRGRSAVASCYTPLGVERITAAGANEAPFELVDALRAAPGRIFDITPPFVCASLDVEGDSLDLFTDALGVGRLFGVRTAWGHVWSNRPVAALLFADFPVVPDAVGWAQSAVADEFYGNRTPFQGVRVVGPATRITWRQERLLVNELDTVTSWLTPQGQNEDLIEQAAADLTSTTASIGRWMKGTPVIDLSGGRDSRLVAAGFLAAGTDMVLHSHDAVADDLKVALELVALLDRDIEHDVEHMSTGGVAKPQPLAAADAARAWHRHAEGLRPATFLHYPVPESLDGDRRVAVGGAGGEVAHSYYGTSADAVFANLDDELRAGIENPVDSPRVLRQFAERIVRRHCPVPGVQREAREALTEHVLCVLNRIQEAGVYGPNALDHFYVLERMRRWGTTAERHGVMSPLLTPSFQRAALALRPEQRRTNALHRQLTEALVPRWRGVPYFPGEMTAQSPQRRAPARILHLADCTDASSIEAVLANPDEWHYPFDPALMAEIWRGSARHETSAAQERLVRSAVWRAAFADIAADINGTPRPHREGCLPPPPEPAPAPAPAPAPMSALKTTRSVVPETRPDPTITALLLQTQAVRRLVNSRAWVSVRDTLPGRRLRRFFAVRR